MAIVGKILDGEKINIAKTRSISLEPETENFKILEADKSQDHLGQLSFMLNCLSRMVYEKLPNDGGMNHNLQNYLLRLGTTVDVFRLKQKIVSLQPNSDVKLSCAIDPTDSGFPTTSRDFYLLEKDQKVAEEHLAKLPSNEELVDYGISILMRGYFPNDVILSKLERDYYSKLLDLEFPERLRINSEVYVGKDKDRSNFKKSFEKLDDHKNLPRYYTAYFSIPTKYTNRSEWKHEFDSIIMNGMQTSAKFEIENLAKNIEAIDPIQLQMIERFDIGPFYNNNTKNNTTIDELLSQNEDNSIMMYKKFVISRIGEQHSKGILNFFKKIIIPYTSKGIFSPVLESPLYALMPHRLIQRAHKKNLQLEDNVKMYGITSNGGILD